MSYRNQVRLSKRRFSTAVQQPLVAYNQRLLKSLTLIPDNINTKVKESKHTFLTASKSSCSGWRDFLICGITVRGRVSCSFKSSRGRINSFEVVIINSRTSDLFAVMSGATLSYERHKPDPYGLVLSCRSTTRVTSSPL